MTKEKLEKKFPVTFPNKIDAVWTNGVKDWHIKNATPGLYTLDIEHISDEFVTIHNNYGISNNIASMYRTNFCVHKCPACFNEQSIVYSQNKRDLDGKLIIDENGNYSLNRMMTLKETINVVKQAIVIAKKEGHKFKSVKFLGPGELLMNPQLFEIIQSYHEIGVQLNIFTKGALLGDDSLAQKYQKMSAKELTMKIASYDNVGLLMSFQSFNKETQDSFVTCEDEHGSVKGLLEYTSIRNKALENIFNSKLYQNRMTNRVCIINAPIVPENIDESYEIYKFFIERGTPTVMTPSMLSGKGCGQYAKQDILLNREEWHEKLIDLYAKIYLLNIEKGIQTEKQIIEEGIASYVGAEPCNQISTGLYIRANGIVQMCPGRFDKETVFENVQNTPLSKIWSMSPNKQKGIDNPKNLINNKCPAKDGLAFPEDFYESVMKRIRKIKKEV